MDLTDWALALDGPVHYLGKVCRDRDGLLRLNPVFEHFVQMSLEPSGKMSRNERVFPFDMIAHVPVTFRPTGVAYLTDFPEWRQQEFVKMLEGALKMAEDFAIQKRSGIQIVQKIVE